MRKTSALTAAVAILAGGSFAVAGRIGYPLAWYRLGDDDPGAAAGNVGNPLTLDHTANHLDLSRAGGPPYPDDVPNNVAATATSTDKLSMKFFNFTGPLDIPQPEPNYYY